MKASSDNISQTLWLNGSFLPVQEAALSPLDRGFLYGDGVFETLRAQDGSLLFLEDHVARLRSSLEALRIEVDLNWDVEGAFGQLLRRNGLEGGAASAKIMVSRGVEPAPGLPAASHPTVCLCTQRYNVPDPAMYETGWRLHVFTEGFSPPLARHKTLNYLYFLTARQAALDMGAHEAVILDPHGRVAETSAGCILARTGGRWWTPATPYRLAGITLGKVSKLMKEMGWGVEERSTTLEALLTADTIWILSSLMLIMPVAKVEHSPVGDLAALQASFLREALLAQRGTGKRRQP